MDKPLNVVTVGQGWPDDRPGGLNRYVADLHVELTSGHAVRARLVTFGPAVEAPGRVLRAGVELGSLPSRVLRMFRAAIRARGGADLLATHFALYGLLPVVAARLSGVPVVAHFHGPWAAESEAGGEKGPGLAVKDLVDRLHLKAASAVITDSRSFAGEVERRFGLPARKIRSVHPGVDLEKFRPSADRAALRHELGVSADTFLVVTARRLVPRMGVGVLLEAWGGVPGAQLVIVGDGASRADLERSAGGRGDVTFTGRVSDEELRRWYQAADLVVVPSLALEGFGLVVLEALACGTPVIASDIGGLGEVLPEVGDDLLLTPGDAGALSDRLLAASEGRLPTREACRRVAEEHSVAAFADAVAGVYRTVAGR